MSTLANLTKAISLRWRILIPLMAGLALLVTVFAVALFAVERVHLEHLEDSLEHELDLIAAYHRDSTRLRGQKLAAVAEALACDPGLRRVLAAGDRQDLLRHVEPIFKGMKQDFSITHFYFYDAARRTLLRVHNPASFGDRIDRITARQAEASGRAAVGVELGKTGTYTLRAVVPVKEGGRLIGYIELGEEILDSLLDLSNAFKEVDGYVLLYKTYLARNDWEQFMRKLGRTPDWEHYPDMVLAAHTRPGVPKFLDALLTEWKGAIRQTGTTVESGAQTYNVASLPLQDAEGREVGRLMLLRNVTDLKTHAAMHMLWVIASAGMGGVVLSVLFYYHLRRTEGKLDRAQAQIVDAAEAREADQRRHIEELTGRINNLERFERLTVGRELRIQAIREENHRLRTSLGADGEPMSPPGAGPEHTNNEGEGHGG